MDRPKAVAMVSGGLDSVVSLSRALESRDVRLVLFFNYGQRSRESERVSVLAVTNFYDLPFREVDISWLEALCPEGMRASVAGDGGALDLRGEPGHQQRPAARPGSGRTSRRLVLAGSRDARWRRPAGVRSFG